MATIEAYYVSKDHVEGLQFECAPEVWDEAHDHIKSNSSGSSCVE